MKQKIGSRRSNRSSRSKRLGCETELYALGVLDRIKRLEPLQLLERLERGSAPLHFTSTGRVSERFMSNVDEPVFPADDFAQINILNRVVRFRHRPRSAGAIDLGLLHGGDHFFAL